MKLTRCKDQRSKTHEEFYGSLAASDDTWSRDVGETMLHLIDLLRTLPEPEAAWGLTSHFHLCLLAADDYHTPWYVRLIGSRGEYTVDYLMPEAEAPWPYARVTGETRSQDRAVEMIETAMRLSRGWER